MSRLVEPAQEHGKLLGMHTDGRIGDVLPLLYDLGFRVIHPVEPECNDIRSLRDAWRGRLAFIGNIPTTLLSFGTNEAVEAAVREACARLGPGGGYVVGSSGSIVDGIPPARFVTMTQAAHTYRRYDLLAPEDAGLSGRLAERIHP
jgi:uroporphyrinogen decarboxylase